MDDDFFEGIKFPKMVKIKQKIDVERIENPKSKLKNDLQKIDLREKIGEGDRIGITVGSRGIASLPELLQVLIEEIKSAGGNPFIIPSMGSHGGGTREGQIEVLESLGVTEEKVGAPIEATTETEKIGTTENGIPIYVNKNALSDVDGIILFNRVKNHTEYSGEIESGIHKIAAIGLGNPKGAKTVHEATIDFGYEEVIKEVGWSIIENLPTLCAIATVENYYYEVSEIEVMEPDEIPEEEKRLLRIAKKRIGKLPFDELDLLIVDEIGKNISGAGIDTNVIGRIMVYGQEEPEKPDIKRIVALDITEESHGNAVGIGLSDYTVKRVKDKIDSEPTILNCITAQTPEKGKIPLYFENDKKAIVAGLRSIGFVKPEEAKVVHIRNTEEMETVEISESLMEEAKERDDMEIIGELSEMNFDKNGNIKTIHE